LGQLSSHPDAAKSWLTSYMFLTWDNFSAVHRHQRNCGYLYQWRTLISDFTDAALKQTKYENTYTLQDLESTFSP